MIDYYSAIKKYEILPFVTAWIDLEGFMLSEINETEKEKYHMISLIWWNLNSKTNEET